MSSLYEVTPVLRRHVVLLHIVVAMAVGAAALLAATPARAGDEGGSGWSFGGMNRVKGSGKVTTETRNVSGFQAVSLKGSMKIVLRQGTREGIELRGDDNILPLVEADVVDRGGVPTLELGMKNRSSYSSSNEIVATVDLVTLRSLSIRGSGNVVADGLKSPALVIAITGSGDVKFRQLAVDELSAKVSGSGDIEFTGRAGKLGVAISGSGDVNTRALEADDVNVSIAGSGDASVTARKTLNVSIAGVGSVKYAGDAVVKSSIAGHGSVTRQ